MGMPGLWQKITAMPLSLGVTSLIYIYIDLDSNEQELLLIPVKKKQ